MSENPPTKVIWKYPVELRERQSIPMPEGAEILRFDAQGEQPMLWALVDPQKPPEPRHLRLAGTGHPISENGLKYIGSCFQGPFVWHLFEGDAW
jgi:hypothetical protein